ncbi:MAG: type I-C CRISPR-associated protein Cas8c/Csd1 [Kiritimatiellia bacterium]
MSFWQLLASGYDDNPALARVDIGGLYPLSSTTISNQSNSLVVITLKQNGDFIRSDVIQKRNDKRGFLLRNFPIPVTQESLNRTSGASAHPIFDSREYVFPAIVEGGMHKETEKNNKYKQLLKEFALSEGVPSFVKAVWNYISNETRNFATDLPEGTKPKTPILFCVEEPGISNTKLWEKPELFSAWHTFYMRKIEDEFGKTLDFIAGSRVPLALFHPKKVLLSSGNAKLVSANDDANFVFRGIYRHQKDANVKGKTTFTSQFGLTDAVTIGYETSQKAHQFLRYLIVSQGIRCGEQVIVPFANRSGVESLPAPPVVDEDEDWGDDELTTTADVMTKLGSNTGLDYAKSIGKALSGYSLDNSIGAHAPTAIAIVESVTP